MAAEPALRPESDGDVIQLLPSGAANNWECVKDVSPDDGISYVYNSDFVTWKRDLYELPVRNGSGAIEKIEVHYRIFIQGKLVIKPDTTEYEGSVRSPGLFWTDYYETYTLNPETSAAWTTADIAKLQIGISLLDIGGKGGGNAYCTQMYVLVYPLGAEIYLVTETVALSEVLPKRLRSVKVVSSSVSFADAVSKRLRSVKVISTTLSLVETIVKRFIISSYAFKTVIARLHNRITTIRRQ